MRPIRGYVLKLVETLALVKLENGLVIETINLEKLKLFERVDVFYDFTRREVVRVRKHLAHAGELEVTQPVLVEADEEDRIQEVLGSGSVILGLSADAGNAGSGAGAGSGSEFLGLAADAGTAGADAEALETVAQLDEPLEIGFNGSN